MNHLPSIARKGGLAMTKQEAIEKAEADMQKAVEKANADTRKARADHDKDYAAIAKANADMQKAVAMPDDEEQP